ncbi:Mediator of RNA polymerase II transcription subunit 7 [Trapelia coarctata]|nr:Mediator of RNA polymerase II transcription subunit 7 [Trapelia coarctata]
MAEQQQSISVAFPAPPPFYKDFTEENVASYTELQAAASTDTTNIQSSQLPHPSILDLPPELRYLRPPSPPPNGKYRSFGESLSLSASLPPLPPETPSLYPSPPTSQHLVRLTRSLLLNFLELLHILATDPSATEYGPKWDDLRDLLRNAHRAVNEYRPHQAREALILLMEEQVERGKREKRGIEELKAKVDEVLAGMEEGLKREGEADGVGGGADAEARRSGHQSTDYKKIEAEKRTWEFLREDLGS